VTFELLPAVDVANGQAVRLVQGKAGSETTYGAPLAAALAWQADGAEWIHLVDLDAAFGRGSNAALLAEVVGVLDVKVEMSGGIRDDESLEAALATGCTRVNIGTAALEKPDWCASVIARYGERFAEALRDIDRTVPDARAKLEAYAGLYADVLRGNRMCMCGVLAGEYETLPDPMQAAVIRFFDDNQTWLVHVLDEGLQDRTLAFSGSKEDVAQTILVTLEGAMLVARPYGDPGRFTATSQQLLLGLAGSRAV